MAKDPYKYFRVEARELLDGLGRGVLELEKGGAGDDVRPRLLRLAHTLKGAARVVKQPEIAELAHAVEDALGGDAPASRASTDAVLRLLDAAAIKLNALGQPAEPAPAAAPTPGQTPQPARPPPAEPMDTMRVDLGDVNAVLEGASEAAVHVAAIREDVRAIEDLRKIASALIEVCARGGVEAEGRAATTFDRAHALAKQIRASLDRVERAASGSVERAEREIAGARDAASRLRLLPAKTAFASLERAARDAASSMGRLVTFESSGGDTRLDPHVLIAVRDALLHAVRNAVAHGSEPESDRKAAGKPPALRITLTVARRSGRIVFTCADDGRGIDLAAVRRAAVRRGAVGPAEAAALSDADVMRLTLTGGVTTTSSVTEVSGRGIGLDVVRETAAALKGDVRLASEPGRGTTIEMSVPISLASLVALVVDAGGVIASIPLDAVRRTLLSTEGTLAETATGDALVHDGAPVPLVALETLIHDGAASGPKPRAGLARAVDPADRASERSLAGARDMPLVGRRSRCGTSVVVLEADGARAAFRVDRVIGTANVVVRPLPATVAAMPVVAGASLDARGDPELVLDPTALVAAARSAKAPARAAPPAKRPPVLVIDDSLTTRMLEQSILESAGYDVALCTSAEEALDAARATRYGLFVVDVEMPGMDGFEFVTRTRADPALRETPAILVTSRDSPEDRRRGERAGAYAYIVKGEFDQTRLLETVRELVG